MSQTYSYDVVVGAVATVMRILHVPIENMIEPGEYSFEGYLERADTAEGIRDQDVRLVVDGVNVALDITGDAAEPGLWKFNFYLEPGATYLVKATFAGTAEYEASETAEYSVTPTMPAPIPTVMEVTTPPPTTPVDAGATFAFAGNLKEADTLVGIEGRRVDLYIDGKMEEPSTTTGTGGSWAFNVTIAEPGTHTIYADFLGDAMYLGCSERSLTRRLLPAGLLATAGLVGIVCLRH